MMFNSFVCFSFILPFCLSLPTVGPPSVKSVFLDVEQVIGPDFNIPEINDAPPIPYDEINSPTHGYAVDIAFHTTPSDMDCLRQNGYRTVFVRAFNPIGDGFFDREVLNTIQNAYEAGLGSEVYVTPQSNSTHSGSDQIRMVYETLRANGIMVRSIWIQVTSPSNWIGTMAHRIELIQDMVQTARNLNLSVGIYTSFYDWLEITGGWNTLPSDVILWYWHVLGMGASGESETTLDDFRPFGPWQNPAVKQFAQVEKVCGMVVNRDVYSTVGLADEVKVEPRRLSVKLEKEGKMIRVGGIGV